MHKEYIIDYDDNNESVTDRTIKVIENGKEIGVYHLKLLNEVFERDTEYPSKLDVSISIKASNCKDSIKLY